MTQPQQQALAAATAAHQEMFKAAGEFTSAITGLAVAEENLRLKTVALQEAHTKAGDSLKALSSFLTPPQSPKPAK